MERLQKRAKFKTANVAAFLIILTCVVFPVLLFFVKVPAENKDILVYMLGNTTGTAMGGAMFYLFNYNNIKSKNEI